MWYVCALGALLLSGNTFANEDPVVRTPKGSLRGIWKTSRSGRQFQAFLGVPYAKPPVAELSFMPPEPMPAWTDTREAKTLPPMCLQRPVIFGDAASVPGVEDCLYLSVYTHILLGKAPVLVHIHGGAFATGTSMIYGPDYLMDEDIVIVDINYRVGIHGFLTFETPELPGNQGMKDQVLALRWVQENIASFGGDPNQVTIIGESAGGASVYHHIVSPLSRGLFHRAIAESGTSYAPWAVSPPGFARANAERLMGLIGCPTDPQEALPCIRKKDPKDVVIKLKDFVEWTAFPIQTFVPTLEAPGPESFLTGPSSQWDHNPVPLMLGLTSGEGLIGTANILKEKEPFKFITEKFDSLAPYTLAYFSGASDPAEVTRTVRDFYLPNDEITINDWANLTLVHTDGLFTFPIMEGANKHKGDVYFYYFDYLSPTRPAMGLPKEYVTGTNHADDCALLWNLNLPGLAIPLGPEDIELSKKFVKMVGSFIKTGKPTIEGAGFKWKMWTPERHCYVHIDNEGFHLQEGLAEDRYKFWKSVKFNDKVEEPVLQSDNIDRSEL